MTPKTTIVREIQQKDNREIQDVIRAIFPEFNLPLVGTAYEDEETTAMFENYQEENAKYFVIEVQNEVLGGGGIKPLNGFDGNICEIQKMYFSPKIRGDGFGKLLFDKLIETAKELGFEKCYLESASILKTAIHIYEKNGFMHLKSPLGNTGHYSCGVWMIKDL